MEYVLSDSGLIPEAVFTYTGISTLKTQSFRTHFGHFGYRNIKPELFYGYRLRSIPVYMNGRVIGRFVKIATPEKAFFDFIYFKSGIITESDILGFRFDELMLEQFDQKFYPNFVLRHVT